MSKTKDFNLDVTTKKSTDGNAKFRSWSLCTPGCVTGVLMTCNLKTATCNCHISK